MLPPLLGAMAVAGAPELRDRRDSSDTRAVCLMLPPSLPAQCKVAEPLQLDLGSLTTEPGESPVSSWGPEASKDGRW